MDKPHWGLRVLKFDGAIAPRVLKFDGAIAPRVLKFDGAIAPRILKFDSGSAAEGCCGRLTFIEGALL